MIWEGSTKVLNMRYSVQVAKVRSKAFKGQAKDLKGKHKANLKTILNATKANGAHWRKNFCGGSDTYCGVTHCIG